MTSETVSRRKDIAILRDLAKHYVDICQKPVQQERRVLWQQKNSLKMVRPLIYVRSYAWSEMPHAKCKCEDPFYREHEDFFRQMLFRDTFNDDSIFEPWVTVRSSYKCTGWGISGSRNFSDEPRGSWKFNYPIKALEDIEKLRAPWHEIDEEKTACNVDRLREAISDIITVNVDRGPAYRMWEGDISTKLGCLRGIENFMVDMIDNPAWLHKLLAFMRDGISRTHEQAEATNDWGLCTHQNQAMPYSQELSDPAANINGVKRSQLWGYMAAQELTCVSPQMHDEFMLQYQLPILKKFGLVAYGCCEDLTHKIDILRQIPNLRRIAVAPVADVLKCAEQIGTDYVLSYRPSPADMVSYGFDPDRIRRILRRDLESCRECPVDITLKDVETVQSDPERVYHWVRIVREVIEKL